MASLTSVMDIAKTALMATQKATNVASHNISNANTPGYSRQTADLAAQDAVVFDGLFFGTGVTVTNVTRAYDGFLADQYRTSNSMSQRYGAKADLLNNIQASVNDFGGSGLSGAIDSLFNSFHDIANSPSSYAERSTLLSNATVLAGRFQRVDTAIRQNISNINSDIQAKINDVNSLASQIADLNLQIASTEIGGISANDLRDKRDLALEKLSNLIDIKVSEDGNRQFNVTIGAGSYLVAGTNATKLEAAISSTGSPIYDIKSNGIVLNSRMLGGSLKGIIDGAEYQNTLEDNLNRLAASIIQGVNVQNRAGYALDGSTNNDIFALPPIYTAAGRNSGGATVSSASISNLSTLSLNDIEVRFSSPTSYIVADKSTNAILSSGTYTSGSPITVGGLTFTISNNTGAPAAGDTFALSVTKNAALNFTTAITNPNLIAAASSAAGLPGDNTNALALAALKDAPKINGSTYSQFYTSIISDLGTKTSEAKSSADAQKKIAEEVKNQKDSSQGVSLEEEAVNMVKLQRAYEAASKVLATADKMLESLLNIR